MRPRNIVRTRRDTSSATHSNTAPVWLEGRTISSLLAHRVGKITSSKRSTYDQHYVDFVGLSCDEISVNGLHTIVSGRWMIVIQTYGCSTTVCPNGLSIARLSTLSVSHSIVNKQKHPECCHCTGNVVLAGALIGMFCRRNRSLMKGNWKVILCRVSC